MAPIGICPCSGRCWQATVLRANGCSLRALPREDLVRHVSDVKAPAFQNGCAAAALLVGGCPSTTTLRARVGAAPRSAPGCVGEAAPKCPEPGPEGGLRPPDRSSCPQPTRAVRVSIPALTRSRCRPLRTISTGFEWSQSVPLALVGALWCYFSGNPAFIRQDERLHPWPGTCGPSRRMPPHMPCLCPAALVAIRNWWASNKRSARLGAGRPGARLPPLPPRGLSWAGPGLPPPCLAFHFSHQLMN